MFRFYNGLSPPSMNSIFKLRAENPCNLRQVSEFSSTTLKIVYHGTESSWYLGAKIWDILEHFKKEIKIWKPDN